MEKDRVRVILDTLAQLYPESLCALQYEKPHELLFAVILSAQCTDARVNMVTPALFARFPTLEAFAEADVTEVEELIRSCGFYHTKARNIVESAGILTDRYGGRVPDTMEALTALPGVGRKTANVVLSNAFGIPAFAVDTHVFRVSNRMGLCKADTVEETERQMTRLIPREKWGQAHHWLIWHGRRLCKAQRPLCAECGIKDLCPYARTGTGTK